MQAKDQVFGILALAGDNRHGECTVLVVGFLQIAGCRRAKRVLPCLESLENEASVITRNPTGLFVVARNRHLRIGHRNIRYGIHDCASDAIDGSRLRLGICLRQRRQERPSEQEGRHCSASPRSSTSTEMLTAARGPKSTSVAFLRYRLIAIGLRNSRFSAPSMAITSYLPGARLPTETEDARPRN